jgi:hypothetical protein
MASNKKDSGKAIVTYYVHVFMKNGLLLPLTLLLFCNGKNSMNIQMNVAIPTRVNFWKKDAKKDLYDDMKYITSHVKPFKFKNKIISIPAHIDKTWLHKSCEYIANLNARSQACLFAYTTPEFWIINGHKAGKNGGHMLTWKPIKDYTVFVQEILSKKEAKYYFKGDVSDLQKLNAQMKSLTKSKEPDAYDKYMILSKKLTDRVKQRKDLFTKKFYKKADEIATRVSRALMFYYQYDQLYGPVTFYEFSDVLPKVSESQWNRVLDLYIKNFDAIFSHAPSVNDHFIAYRGTEGKVLRHIRSYTSMTLSKDVARDFINKNTNCCLHEVKFEKYSAVLPIMVISRVQGELEILVHPDAKYKKSILP